MFKRKINVREEGVLALRKGISSLLVYVLLIGVTLAIIIGFIGYAMSVWSHQGTYRTLLVYPDTRIDTENNVLVLHIANKGSVTAIIYKIVVQNIETLNATIIIKPGEEKEVTEELSGSYKPGSTYVIEIYTKEGSVLKKPAYIPIKAG